MSRRGRQRPVAGFSDRTVEKELFFVLKGGMICTFFAIKNRLKPLETKGIGKGVLGHGPAIQKP